MRFADDRNGWIYSPELWATHDGGATWQRPAAPPGETLSVEAVDGVVTAVSGGRVFTSATGTDAWRRLGPEPVDPYAQLAGRYVGGGDGAVLAVTATGLERRGTPCPHAGASLADTGEGVVAVCTLGAAMGSSTKSFAVSTDGARTWRPAGEPPAPGSVLGVAAASPSTVVVAAASGASWLYRTDDGGRSWATA